MQSLLASLILILVPATSIGDETLELNCGLAEVNRDCELEAKRIVSLVEQRVTQQVLPPNSPNGLYRRKDHAIMPKAGVILGKSKREYETIVDNYPPVEICSPNGNRFNGGKPEISKNNLLPTPKSCGSADTIETRKDSTGVIRMQLMVGSGTLERSYLYGIYLEGLECVLREVTEEITKNYSIKLPGTASTNACQSLLSEYNAAKEHLKMKYKRLTKGVSPKLCQSTTPAKEGLPEQAGCYAIASMEALDSTFSYLATCEVFRRSNEQYSAFKDEYFSPVARQKWWLIHADHCSKTTPAKSANPDTVFTQCYQRQFSDTVTKEAQKWFRYDPKLKCGKK